MKKDRTFEILYDAILAEGMTPVTEEEAGEYFGNESPGPEDEVELQRGRAQFAKIMLDDIHPEPVWAITGRQAFGQWLKEERERARLTRQMIASALDQEVSFVEKLEAGLLSPLQLRAWEAASIAILFSMHIDAIRQLIKNTPPPTASQRKVKRDYRPTSSHASGLLMDLSGESLPVEDREPSRNIDEWIRELIKELQRRQATHLLR